MSEGKELSDWLESEYFGVFDGYKDTDDISEYEQKQQQRAKQLATRIQVALTRYDANKAAKTGTVIRCAYCGKKVIKTTYHMAFCSNGKTRKGGNCKDRFHNMVSNKRRERTKRWTQ